MKPAKRAVAAPTARAVAGHHGHPHTAVQLAALQGSIGNAAVSEAVRRGLTAVRDSTALGGSPAPAAPAVQLAPATDQTEDTDQPTFTFDPNMAANPVLYTDFAEHYWVGSAGSEPEGYYQIEQHCAYLAAYWLTHGHSPSGLRFLNLPDQDRLDGSNMVREWASQGGLAAQTQYAEARLGGHVVTKAQLTSDAASGELPPGTLIWFGSDTHAEAAVATGKNQFLMYDPNTGKATTRDGKGFIAYIATKNAFVVKLGQGADPETCKCCVIM
ncbi:hypothetical protein AB0G54_28855 [Streptomyces yokosukanensis]|uniref:hypothetical protein n=1 Tax=Streptomyces yokosukanensis TaxID=67386 RepID=UPI00131E5D17|nr:hypothetical protein [Streptomyces yokosukanensis]